MLWCHDLLQGLCQPHFASFSYIDGVNLVMGTYTAVHSYNCLFS